MANAPIDFFGKVIDEEGNPVVGASTFYILGTLSFQGSPTPEGPKTDEKGFFSITGKRGPTLSVWVQHDRYYSTATAKQRFEYARKVERSDALNFEAPAEGYVPWQTINMPASLAQDAWKSDIQRDYFVKFGSGNYGRV
jgi:hypothetical protein